MQALIYLGPGKKALQERAKPGITAATDAIVRITRTTSLYPIPDGADEEAVLMLSDILPTGFECGVLDASSVHTIPSRPRPRTRTRPLRMRSKSS